MTHTSTKWTYVKEKVIEEETIKIVCSIQRASEELRLLNNVINEDSNKIAWLLTKFVDFL